YVADFFREEIETRTRRVTEVLGQLADTQAAPPSTAPVAVPTGITRSEIVDISSLIPPSRGMPRRTWGVVATVTALAAALGLALLWNVWRPGAGESSAPGIRAMQPMIPPSSLG